MGKFGRGVGIPLFFAVGISATAVLRTAVAVCFCGRKSSPNKGVDHLKREEKE